MMGQRRITRLLIANRGEIACRVARTAHRLGISSVGVYSEPDRNALHVDAVDIAVALGGSTPAESYLRGDAIIDAALRTGADAIHPGYGFLAENADFAEAVIAAGLIWVGPTPHQIRLLGDKIAAKQAAIAAGVPTTPIIPIIDGAWHEPLPAFPLLVKAAAGGGGRGMRVVTHEDDLADAIASASREAAAAFGDGTTFIEPFIARGRHVEVQVMGDTHGNVIHLGERECSIQRRNQKVVEESPSPGVSDATRAALHAGAVALSRHVGYVGAGTVEFMVGEPDATGEAVITFLEVNTRLQVEHPVTEAVTGFDLVELQLLVAAGAELPFEQHDVVVRGHAIEVRVVAEDPAAGWLPSVGTVTEFAIAGDGVRVDTGFRTGSHVSADYDSMLAKVICHHADRSTAAAQLARALRTGCVAGVRTNIPALVQVLGEADFLAGNTPTSYLDEHPEVVAADGPSGDDRVAQFLAAVFTIEQRNRAADSTNRFAPSGWRNLRTQGQRRALLVDGHTLHVEYVIDSRDAASVHVLVGEPPAPDASGVLSPDGRRTASVRLLVREVDRQVLEFDGIRYDVAVRCTPDGFVTSSSAGALHWIEANRFDEHDLAAAGGGPVCPLPGTVIAVHVSVGDSVTEGQLLMVVEAMKMEHQITAAADATVTEVRFDVGDRVDQGDLLVALDSAEAAT